ncbi:hypothetical protein [Sulfitobacter sp.]|uniref:hypothetical protein n=1 Tax=Sulfitobacter sp. TaxID=1903071 RepID=UPI003EF9E4B2
MFVPTAEADDTTGDLQSIITSVEATIHPHAILGVSPNMDVESASGTLSLHFERDLVPEEVTLSIQSPEGRLFQYVYSQRLTTPWVDPFVRMGSEDYEEITVDLATGVLDGRVLAVHRTIAMFGTDRPSAEAVFAQLIESYGQPSAIVTGSYDSELIYAYGSNGFIADLPALEASMHPVVTGQPMTASISRFGSFFHDDVPCTNAVGRDAYYEFRMPRREDPLASCDAALRVRVQSSGPKTTIHIDLMDYRLIRANRAETDRQILEALDEEQAPSRIEL